MDSSISQRVSGTVFDPPVNVVVHGSLKSFEIAPDEPVYSQGSQPFATQGFATQGFTTQDFATQETLRDASKRQLTEEEREEQQRASDMQLWWSESMSRNMNVPDGYSDVAVLIIKWQDDIDQLKCGPEVQELKQVFTDNFGYSTEILELSVTRKPQHQLNSTIARFVEDNDGLNKLMIFYYTGHGTYLDKTGSLELSATDDPQTMKGFLHPPRVNFSDIERMQLQSPYIEADVLVILDTCFSSNIQKSGLEDDRTYELLSACGLDQTTSSPGPNSFTRALIDSLRGLLGDAKKSSFTTFNLQQRINLHAARRDTPALLWNRLRHHDRHIRLAPLRRNSQRKATHTLCHGIGSYLNLRFGLKDTHLSREQIESFTKGLAFVFKNAPNPVAVRRIDWMGIRKSSRADGFRRGALALHFFIKWRKLVQRAQGKKRKQALDCSTSAKRPIDEEDEEISQPRHGPPSFKKQRSEHLEESSLAMSAMEGVELQPGPHGPLTPASE